jgi:hypothetical protein
MSLLTLLTQITDESVKVSAEGGFRTLGDTAGRGKKGSQYKAAPDSRTDSRTHNTRQHRADSREQAADSRQQAEYFDHIEECFFRIPITLKIDLASATFLIC